MEETPNPKLSMLNDLLFEGGGEFNHLIWQVQPTLCEGSVSDKLSSLHEWTHHELNNSTTYGLLLTYFAFLARHADDNRARFAELLRQFVTGCHVAHEIYATWHSVELLSGMFPLTDILSKLPPDYLAYFRLGDGFVSEIESSFLRQQAFLTVVRSCFESPTFAQFDCQTVETFDFSEIRGSDLPDTRLRFLVKRIKPGLFAAWSEEYCESHDDGSIRTALTRTRSEDFFDLPLQEADASLARFLKWLSNKWRDWLSGHGVIANEYEFHLTKVRELVEDMNSRCSSATVTHPLRATTSPHDSAAVLLHQMESEIVQLREAPLPAEIIPLSALPRSIWPSLPVGVPAHLFFQARSFDDMARQHVFVESQDLNEFEKSRSKPIVFLRRSTSTDISGTAPVRLLLFRQTEELRELRRLTSDVPAFGLISSSLSVDSEWWNEWLDPSILWISKIDHSLSVFLEQHCARQDEVRYSTATIRDANRLAHFVTFLTRSIGESQWGLYIGFCGEHTAKACVQFIAHKFDPGKFVFDREPFEGDLAQALSVIATHMMRDEYFFSFNQLSYS